jgi:hypothetical protein
MRPTNHALHAAAVPSSPGSQMSTWTAWCTWRTAGPIDAARGVADVRHESCRPEQAIACLLPCSIARYMSLKLFASAKSSLVNCKMSVINWSNTETEGLASRLYTAFSFWTSIDAISIILWYLYFLLRFSIYLLPQISEHLALNFVYKRVYFHLSNAL